ncbi:HD family phosphohydrolase [Bacteroides sp. 224]|uniref:HD family phosphohydrolase n=1 Tax=Bacteroides sp. 224 TaxID=2302936 RepID=UPI0013CFA171|nr:HDIG domain-containing metalloprotein [Bacteroides sp. 224]NDV63815.1 HDIG domain-containing protein [Bacteroides sp. 224]
MFRIKIRKNLPYKAILLKTCIFIATVGIIVYFLPRDGKFNYQFDLNRPWKYGQLMATFDFPIYKDEAIVKKEHDSLMAAFQPYYTLESTVEKEAIAKFREDYNANLKSILPSADYARHIEKVLKEVYKSGIIMAEDLKRLQQDSISTIKVIEEKEASQRYTAGIFTTKEAYEYVLSADIIHFKKDILRQCSLNEYINANLIHDEQRTETALNEVMGNYSWANGLVQSGQKIVDRGEIIDEQTYSILESLRKESIKRSETRLQVNLIWGGQILFVSVLILLFILYLQMFRAFYFDRFRNLLLLFLLIIFYCVITGLMVSNNVLSIYVIPYAMLPMIIRIFLDSRTAFLAHVITLLICSTMLRYPYDFILLQIPAGLAAILSLRELSQRSQLFRTALIITLTYAATYFAYELIIENDLTKLNRSMYAYFIINGILLLFAYPFLFLLEKLFGFTSNVTLVELSNINNPLLRRLSETAAGTFQHSMQVANLSAEAAIRIGAKSQLVRTGALYHDIGKMENPAFFTENQQGGVNPHKTLPYEQSAQIIINHVKDGLRLADKHNLPQAIKDFISSHHGLGKTKYFYISWKNEHPDEEPDEEWFTYPGPNPFSKETAILMMADAVEAASRSLPEYTEESISNLVNKIIDSQVADGFFKECPITFLDIATVKKVFIEKLTTSYHTRISYPELKK